MAKPLSTSPAQAKETGSSRVYSQLRQDILRVDLAPGSALDEVGLSERFGLSRSPIREALVRLSSEGLVDILPNRSTIVTPLNLDKLPEFLDALDLYQRVTTRSAAMFRTQADLDVITAAQKRYVDYTRISLDTGDSIPMIDSNYEFHMAIARAGRNRYFTNFYSRVLNDGRRLLHFHLEFQRMDPDISVEKLGAGHEEMIEAIRLRDADGAERVAHEHAAQFKGRFMQFLNRNVSSAVDLTAMQPSHLETQDKG
ncbi:GntR family transcriptional regulator [Agrobacterium sp. NPDC090283]|uniref:GntR family transcriptional regulator n=1 Tax=Agrobacterium sp. NPDC090283 TaxID=3363920 RepID=UPI00383AF376